MQDVSRQARTEQDNPQDNKIEGVLLSADNFHRFQDENDKWRGYEYYEWIRHTLIFFCIIRMLYDIWIYIISLF